MLGPTSKTSWGDQIPGTGSQQWQTRHRNSNCSCVPDIIITDIMMPELDGHGFCPPCENDKLLSHIPVIMLTSKAEDEDKIRGLQPGQMTLTKPFRLLNWCLKSKTDHYRLRLQESFWVKSMPLLPIQQQRKAWMRASCQVRDVIQQNLDDEGFSVVELSQR